MGHRTIPANRALNLFSCPGITANRASSFPIGILLSITHNSFFQIVPIPASTQTLTQKRKATERPKNHQASKPSHFFPTCPVLSHPSSSRRYCRHLSPPLFRSPFSLYIAAHLVRGLPTGRLLCYGFSSYLHTRSIPPVHHLTGGFDLRSALIGQADAHPALNLSSGIFGIFLVALLMSQQSFEIHSCTFHWAH